MEVGGDKSIDNETETATESLSSNDSATENVVSAQQQNLSEDNETGKEKRGEKADKLISEQEDKNPEERLCGWLQHRAKGIGNLKGIRQRWFVYSEENCKLYMYRHPEDLCPLGEFNIDTASFYFDGGNIDKPGVFEIKTDSKDVFLDAGSRQHMMFWLQALQNKRKMFNLSRGSGPADSAGQKTKKQYGGLIGKEAESPANIRRVFDPGRPAVDNIPEIHLSPSETSGSNSSLNSSGQPPSKHLSFFALSSIQSKLSNIKFPGRSQKDVSSILFGRNSKTQDVMSASMSSVNSNDSLLITDDCSQSVSSTDDTKERTASQLSMYSDGSDIITETRDQQGYSKISSKTGTWTVISNNELTGVQAELEKEDYIRNAKSKFYTENDIKELDGKYERSGSESDTGKAGKLFSTLKKIRIGKRQISEPGTTLSSACPKCKTPLMQNGQGQQSAPHDPSNRTSSLSGASKDYEDLEDELKANREIVEVLQKQLDVFQKEILSRQKTAELDDQGKTDLIMEKEIIVSDLNKQLSRTNQEYAATTEKLQSVEEEFSACKEQLSMYEDMLKAKDETIVGLSTQIFDKEQEGPDITASSEAPQPTLLDINTSPVSYEKELLRMKDMCQGYELQHKFLTKEILELNELRKMDLAREKKLNIDYAKLEAKYCQVKSKYFVLLKQRKEQMPVRGDVDGHEVVSQLIQDAMETDEDDIELHLTGSVQEFDRYGFSRRQFLYEEEADVDEDPLSNRAAEFERQSEQLNTQVKDLETSNRVKWENFMIGRGGKLTRNNDLKTLVRHGIPPEYRMDVWKGCMNLYVGVTREKLGPGFYKSLLQKKKEATSSDPSIKQIELDLLRTLPNNKHYEDIESPGIIKLRNVLRAYSEYNKHIGYCQGLNRLAAIALLILDEEDAFWCLVAIVEHILPPEYFSTSLMAAQADQRVLKDLVQDKLSKLHAHFEKHDVDMSLFAFNWFLTLFVDNIPTETFLRIWDTILYEGSKVLFRFAVAFLKKAEHEILEQDDGLKLNRYLRSIGQKMTDIKLISYYAFHWINPFPMRFLANRRQFHIQQIKDELLELDKIRHGVRMNREQEHEEENYFSDDDLDT